MVLDASAVNVIVVGEHAVAAIVPGRKLYFYIIRRFENYYDRPHTNVRKD